jgi:hypothetical protein
MSFLNMSTLSEEAAIEAQKRKNEADALNKKKNIVALPEEPIKTYKPQNVQQLINLKLPQQQQISMPLRLSRGRKSIYSFTNRPFMNDDFMVSDPFGENEPNPFFPRRRPKSPL